MVKTKKAIITGATGQDGSYMCEYLLKNTDLEVIAAIRRTSQDITTNLKDCESNPRFKYVRFDLNDVHSITSVIKSEKPDYFINFGACAFVPDSWTNPAMTMQTNAISIIHILEAIKEHAPNCRFYSSGTSEQFANSKQYPQNEDTLDSPRSIYGVSKSSAQQIVKVYRESYGLYAIHGKLFNHESPRRQSYYLTKKVTLEVARIFNEMICNKTPQPMSLGNMSAKRDWSDARDFIDGIWRMLNQEVYNEDIKKEFSALPYPQRTTKWLSGKVKEYVLSSGKTHSVAEFVEKAFEVANIDVELRFDKMGDWSTAAFYVRGTEQKVVQVDPKFFRPAEVDLLLGDSTKIKNELGWNPEKTFEDLVEEMVNHDIYEKRK